MKKLILTFILFLPHFALATTQKSNEEANPQEAHLKMTFLEGLWKWRDLQDHKRQQENCGEKYATDYFKEETKIRNQIFEMAEQYPQVIEPNTIEPYSLVSGEKSDCSPLAIAAGTYRARDLVRYLLIKGANPNPDCKDCLLPLIQASEVPGFRSCEPRIISTLLQYKADPFKKDPQLKISPFEYALIATDHKALQEYLYQEFVREEINNPSFSIDGSDIKSSALQTLFLKHHGNVHDLHECITLLFNYQANMHEIDANGNTFLHSAAKKYDDTTIELLHNLGVRINQQNSAGQTPLHIAIALRKDNVFRKLLELGADPNVVDSNGETALFNLIRNCNDISVIKQLWDATDKSVKNNDGETVLDIIKQRYLALKVTGYWRVISSFEEFLKEKNLFEFITK